MPKHVRLPFRPSVSLPRACRAGIAVVLLVVGHKMGPHVAEVLPPLAAARKCADYDLRHSLLPVLEFSSRVPIDVQFQPTPACLIRLPRWLTELCSRRPPA